MARSFVALRPKCDSLARYGCLRCQDVLFAARSYWAYLPVPMTPNAETGAAKATPEAPRLLLPGIQRKTLGNWQRVRYEGAGGSTW